MGRGKGGKGLGKGGAKRHRKVLRDNIQGITKPAIRRLARRGGVKRISGLIYEETRGVLKTFMESVIRDAVTYTEHARRKTVTAMDVVYALKRQGRTLYGFGGDSPRPKAAAKQIRKTPATTASRTQDQNSGSAASNAIDLTTESYMEELNQYAGEGFPSSETARDLAARVIKAATRNKLSSEITEWKPPYQGGNLLTRPDDIISAFASLQDGQYLNDDVMITGFQWACAFYKEPNLDARLLNQLPEQFRWSRTFSLTSQFCTRLATYVTTPKPDPSGDPEVYNAYERNRASDLKSMIGMMNVLSIGGVRRRLNKFNSGTYGKFDQSEDMVIIPFNWTEITKYLHWGIVAVELPTLRVHYFDSIGRPEETRMIKTLAPTIRDVFVKATERRLEHVNTLENSRVTVKQYRETLQTIKSHAKASENDVSKSLEIYTPKTTPKVPMQNDDYNCGMFAILTARAIRLTPIDVNTNTFVRTKKGSARIDTSYWKWNSESMADQRLALASMFIG